MTTRILAGLLLAGAAVLAAKEKLQAGDYRTAMVLDATMSRQRHLEAAGAASALETVTVDTNQLVLRGDGYDYVIWDTREKSAKALIPLPAPALGHALANRHHGCRFIVGETVRYAQSKGDLRVIDVDGKQCTVQIVRQQKRTQ